MLPFCYNFVTKWAWTLQFAVKFVHRMACDGIWVCRWWPSGIRQTVTTRFSLTHMQLANKSLHILVHNNDASDKFHHLFIFVWWIQLTLKIYNGRKFPVLQSLVLTQLSAYLSCLPCTFILHTTLVIMPQVDSLRQWEGWLILNRYQIQRVG